jgi:hypothetical protein
MRMRARPLDLPLSTPIATAEATLRTATLVLADGQTDQGIVGMGQTPRPCRSYRHPDGPTHSPTLSATGGLRGSSVADCRNEARMWIGRAALISKSVARDHRPHVRPGGAILF